MHGYTISSRFVRYIYMKSNSSKYVLAVILPMIVGELFVSCKQGNPVVSTSLDRIEQVVVQHPDSALSELNRLDSLLDSGAVSIEGDRQIARYALLKTQTNDKNYIDDTNDSLILRAVRYYDEHGSDRERMLAHFYHGAIFRNAKNYGAAFVAYRQAESLALELDDDHYLCLIYGNLASISHDTYSKDAIMYAQKNLEYARKSGDVREAFQAKADMARTYSVRLVYDTAEYWFRNVLDSLQDTDPIVQSCLTSYIEQCITNEKYQLADSLLNLLSPIEQPVDLLNKACLFQMKGISDSADIYIRRAKEAIITPEQTIFYYEKLSWISEMKGELSSAIEFNRARIKEENEVVTTIFSKSVSDYQRNFEQQRREYVEYRYTQYKRWSILAALLCILLVVLLFSYFYRLFMSRNRILDETIVKYVEQSVLVENQEATMGALESQIEALQLKLQTARSMGMTSKLSRLFVDRFSIFDRLGIIFFNKQGKIDFRQTVFEAVNEEIKRLYSDDKTIEEIDQIIDNYFDGAMTKAKMTDLRLTNADVNFLRYILMGFSYETIAYLFDKNDMEALYTRKKRLKQKLKQSDVPQAKDILESLEKIKRNLGDSEK